jgi:1,4-dihydroxy-2-naphthoyl-CoA synthase
MQLSVTPAQVVGAWYDWIKARRGAGAGGSDGEFVRLEVADGIGTIRLDRPKMNALNLQVQTEIEECAREATLRDDVAAVIVYGGERVFAAGADIKEMQSMSYTDMAVAVEGLHSFTTTLARMPPSVCDHQLCPGRRLRVGDVLRLPARRRSA